MNDIINYILKTNTYEILAALNVVKALASDPHGNTTLCLSDACRGGHEEER
jgi:hypothetical protein